ncbi:DUF4962 domain-containing protein, partial [candidate division KSB1 bacterium]|nr:DUF4962 domain-containing protein [candidate division KSB1 bacterium]
MRIRIAILGLCWIWSTTINSFAATIDFPEQRSTETDLIPRPENGHVAEINPPGFAWLPVPQTWYYRIQIIDQQTQKVVFTRDKIEKTVFVPGETIPPGRYLWTIEAFDRNDQLLAQRRPYSLTIPPDLPEQPYPDLDKLLLSFRKAHPRFIFNFNREREIRESLTTSRKEAWKCLKATADSSLNLPALMPPIYDQYDLKTQYNQRRLAYKEYYHYLRKYIDQGLQALSMAWLITRDEKYAIAAKHILLEVATWNPHGISSCQHSGFDEVGLSLARCTHRAYDWLEDALTKEERRIVLLNCVQRARDTYERVAIRQPFLRSPGSSHDGRLIAYLGEQAIVLATEAPPNEVKNWLDYSLTAFMTIYPHWGGKDGGWAEGIAYGQAYNLIYSPWIEGLRTLSEIDLWQRPFFRKVRQFFLYCTRPNAETIPFGDGAERNINHSPIQAAGFAALLRLHAERFDDPVCWWWAAQLPAPDHFEFYPVIPILPAVPATLSPPQDFPLAACFQGIGWCAMHS